MNIKSGNSYIYKGRPIYIYEINKKTSFIKAFHFDDVNNFPYRQFLGFYLNDYQLTSLSIEEESLWRDNLIMAMCIWSMRDTIKKIIPQFSNSQLTNNILKVSKRIVKDKLNCIEHLNDCKIKEIKHERS